MYGEDLAWALISNGHIKWSYLMRTFSPTLQNFKHADFLGAFFVPSIPSCSQHFPLMNL